MENIGIDEDLICLNDVCKITGKSRAFFYQRRKRDIRFPKLVLSRREKRFSCKPVVMFFKKSEMINYLRVAKVPILNDSNSVN